MHPVDRFNSAAPKQEVFGSLHPLLFFGCAGEGPQKLTTTSAIACHSSVLQQDLDKHQNVSSREPPPYLEQGAWIYRTTRLCRRAGATASGDLPFVSPGAEQRDIAHRTGSWCFVTHCGPECSSKHRQRDTQRCAQDEMTRSGSSKSS